MLILVKNIKTTLTLVKILIVLDFGQNLQKSRIWSKFSKNLDFYQSCWKISILVKTYQNVDFRQKLQKC